MAEAGAEQNQVVHCWGVLGNGAENKTLLVRSRGSVREDDIEAVQENSGLRVSAGHRTVHCNTVQSLPPTEIIALSLCRKLTRVT